MYAKSYFSSYAQYHPINYANYLLANLNKVANQTIEDIYVGRLVTHIAIALGLRNCVAHLTPARGYNLLNIDHYLN